MSQGQQTGQQTGDAHASDKHRAGWKWFALSVLVLAVVFFSVLAQMVEEHSSITGTTVSSLCDEVGVAVVRRHMIYNPLAALGGWGRGVPWVLSTKVMLYKAMPEEKTITNVATLSSLPQWSTGDSGRLRASVRVLPDRSWVVGLYGCPANEQECSVVWYSKEPGKALKQLKEWPQVSKEESDGYKQCSTRLIYPEPVGTTVINVGSEAKGWHSVVNWRGNELTLISERP